MSHAPFLNTIRAAPEDDTARLVYADYLDEQGGAANVARAEFIRVQIALFRCPETDPQRPALEDRENELLRAHEATWLGALPAEVTGWTFERGFLTELRAAPAVLAEAATRAVVEQNPVTRLCVYKAGSINDGCARLARRAWLAGVRELTFEKASLYTQAIADLLTSRHLARLNSVALGFENQYGGVCALLRKCPWFGIIKRFALANWNRSGENHLAQTVETMNVEELSFSNTAIDLSALLRGRVAERLTRLELNGLTAEHWRDLQLPTSKPALTHLKIRSLAPGSVVELLRSPACGKVVELNLNSAQVSASTVEALVRSEFWPRCRAFEIVQGKCPPATTQVLALNINAPRLRVLNLGETGLRDAGVAHVCAAPWANTLAELDLGSNHLTDDACEAIRASGQLTQLRTLDISFDGPKLGSNTSESITDAGLEALAHAPGLARLRTLNASGLPIGTRGAVALLTSPHFRLAQLDINGTNITADTIRELARCPNLARLTHLNLSSAGFKGDDLLPLIESEYLSPLCTFGAGHYQFSRRCQDALRARLGRRFQKD
jgi:uncharacterized protein (TIGR02996 family)